MKVLPRDGIEVAAAALAQPSDRLNVNRMEDVEEVKRLCLQQSPCVQPMVERLPERHEAVVRFYALDSAQRVLRQNGSRPYATARASCSTATHRAPPPQCRRRSTRTFAHSARAWKRSSASPCSPSGKAKSSRGARPCALRVERHPHRYTQPHGAARNIGVASRLLLAGLTTSGRRCKLPCLGTDPAHGCACGAHWFHFRFTAHGAACRASG